MKREPMLESREYQFSIIGVVFGLILVGLLIAGFLFL